MGTYDTTYKSIQTLDNLHLSPADAAATAANYQAYVKPSAGTPTTIQSIDGYSAGVGAVKIAVTMVETFGKEVPGLGTSATITNLGLGLKKLGKR